LIEEVAHAAPLSYLDDESITFLAALSRRLLRDPAARSRAELVSLAYFLRRSALERLAQENPSTSGPCRRYPIGTVFHIPPANVDTMFVYSWARSLLCGNKNIIRVSSRARDAVAVIERLLSETMEDGNFDRLAATQRMVTYDRDDEVTSALSAACDLRVIWGGDGTVRSIRKHPLRPSARDLSFPDRNSFAVVSAEAFESLDDGGRRRVAEQLYNDMYWFDQAGCSSPRWLVWQANPDRSIDAVRASLLEHLDAVIRSKAYHVETGMAIDKLSGAYGAALRGEATHVGLVSNELVSVWADDIARLPRQYSGAGILFEARVAGLTDLSNIVKRQDQTLGHFGFTAAQLSELADACNGRGVDRLVPLGDALAFSAVWDGLDLMDQLTRIVEIRTSHSSAGSSNPVGSTVETS
jgi:hypothetical protein